jgi:outer membrane protein TolC
VIAARTQRDVAFLRLRQLLHLPSDQPLALSTPLDESVPVNANDLRAAGNILPIADTSVAGRTSVRQAAELVNVQESQLKITRGQRLPAVSLSTNYQRFAYPSGVFEDKLRYYFPNWTVSLGASMPIFTGGRQRGDQMVAEANLAEARERYHQSVLGAVLDAQIARAQLEQAQATLIASAGTDEQAARGYAIAEVRFTEGIATQLELAQARVDLETARANRVQAARGLALARLRVALLSDLPLGAVSVGGR